jgi:hypothetical protein
MKAGDTRAILITIKDADGALLAPISGAIDVFAIA